MEFKLYDSHINYETSFNKLLAKHFIFDCKLIALNDICFAVVHFNPSIQCASVAKIFFKVQRLIQIVTVLCGTKLRLISPLHVTE